MTWNDHDHRGQYAEERHDHDGDYAEKHHLHYDLAGDAERAHRRITAMQEEVDELRAEVAELRGELAGALERITALAKQTPSAEQLQLEADLAAADLAESGYDRDPPAGADRHGPGCQCPYCYDEDEDTGGPS
jgi:predicted  nucleic acid-binding Zn-ribbon protein